MDSFFASCKEVDVNPYAWMTDTLNRIGNHLINKLPPRGNLQIRSFSFPAPEVVSCSQWHYYRVGSCYLQKRDHWWCILVAKYGAFLFTEIGAVVITDYTVFISSRRRSSFSCGLSPFSCISAHWHSRSLSPSRHILPLADNGPWLQKIYVGYAPYNPSTVFHGKIWLLSYFS